MLTDGRLIELSCGEDVLVDPGALAFEYDRLSWSGMSAEEQDRWTSLARAIEEAVERDVVPEVPSRADDEHAVNVTVDVLGLDPGDFIDDTARVVKERLALEREEGAKDALTPSRQSVQQKAYRILLDGRLVVKRIDVAGDRAGLIVAEARSKEGAVYALGYDPRKNEWRCTCEAGRTRTRCSHVAALQLVAVAKR